MFFYNYRSTEPVWFRFFRDFFAIILTGIIVYYSFIQFLKIDTKASIDIKFESIYGHSLNMSICTGISNGVNKVEFNSESYGANPTETIPRNFSDPYCNPHTIPNNLLSLNFESLQYFSITDDNEDIKYILELNPRLEQLPIQLESNEVRVKVLLLSDPRIARFETTRKYDYLISKLGGFYGAIAGIFYLFFGMQRHKPWGLAQKYLFSCTQCRKSLKKYFAKKYVSSAGIPLVEKVNKRPEGSSLEERVQILESLLQDYYLDDYYLKKIKDVRTKHKKLLKKYGRQDNENTENTELNASLV
ncbi:10611_t:CDS:2 [Rhizophagus irregularis]|nr:10611_t:CDS:2 [Rhizophagus irregularis]